MLLRLLLCLFCLCDFEIVRFIVKTCDRWIVCILDVLDLMEDTVELHNYHVCLLRNLLLEAGQLVVGIRVKLWEELHLT